jgi:hypothetical protein
MMHLQSGRVRFAMWNLNPDYVQQVKEELKGRRAAILARHAQELKALEADLDEVETIERLAQSFAAKHLPELAAAKAEAELEAVMPPQPSSGEAEAVALSEPLPAAPEPKALAILQTSPA